MKARSKAFTLTELLVVMGIIIILSAMVGGGLNAVRAKARRASCLSRLRSIGQAALLYAHENFSKFPHSAIGGRSFGALYDPIDFNDMETFICPTQMRQGLPTHSSGTISPDSRISYRFVEGTSSGETQTTSYPISNIFLIEDFSGGDSNALFDEDDFHSTAGGSAYQINGKGLFVGQTEKALPQNQDKTASSTYTITASKLYT